MQTDPQTIVVAGGNSGIGLHAARTFVARGHRVVLLGRDRAKGERARASFGSDAGRVTFLPVDLSTHDGVRAAAARVLDAHDRIDVLAHTTGVFTSREERTADGLHPFFAVNYLSRYHLTQLLLPALRAAQAPRVLMMTAKIAPDTPVDLAQFPSFAPFDLGRMRKPIQVANHHYAAHLARTEPEVPAGVVNAGAARTDILRATPWLVRASAALLAPVMFDSLDDAAHNVVEGALSKDWEPATYWDKPAAFARRTRIVVDDAVTSEIMRISKEITGA